MNPEEGPFASLPDNVPEPPRPLWGPAGRPGRSASPSRPAAPVRTDPPVERPDPWPTTPTAAPGITPPLEPGVPSSAVSGAVAGSGAGPRRTALLVGLTLATLLMVGSLVAVQQLSTSTAPAASNGGTLNGSTGGGSASSIATTTAAPTPTLVPSAGLVEVSSSAARHPYAASVAALLDRHFSAINDRDYSGWASTVVTRRANDQPAVDWQRAYRSTTDDSIVVDSISGDSDDLTVDLSFVSYQDPTDAPPDLAVTQICWRSEWPISDITTGGRIDIPVSGSTTKWAC